MGVGLRDPALQDDSVKPQVLSAGVAVVRPSRFQRSPAGQFPIDSGQQKVLFLVHANGGG
jgi:hypothetical protein